MMSKKILFVIAVSSLLIFSHVSRSQHSDTNVSYQELSPEEKSVLDAKFVDRYPTYSANASPQSAAPLSSSHSTQSHIKTKQKLSGSSSYGLPKKIATAEKVIIVDPTIHAWGAYSAAGNLLRAGTATAGSKWCPDIHRACKTKAGTFRIYTLGSSECVSTKYPVGEGGAPMPYCMYFNGSQGVHGSHQVVNGNISHGCIRVRVSDAYWLRNHFASVGTKVIIKPY
jgi:lipoprotein-anchoring transpeptidase ErfK/SrfK